MGVEVNEKFSWSVPCTPVAELVYGNELHRSSMRVRLEPWLIRNSKQDPTYLIEEQGPMTIIHREGLLVVCANVEGRV